MRVQSGRNGWTTIRSRKAPLPLGSKIRISIRSFRRQTLMKAGTPNQIKTRQTSNLINKNSEHRKRHYETLLLTKHAHVLRASTSRTNIMTYPPYKPHLPMLNPITLGWSRLQINLRSTCMVE